MTTLALVLLALALAEPSCSGVSVLARDVGDLELKVKRMFEVEQAMGEWIQRPQPDILKVDDLKRPI